MVAEGVTTLGLLLEISTRMYPGKPAAKLPPFQYGGLQLHATTRRSVVA